MKAFMDDVTRIAETRSHMEQLVTYLQGLFKWAAMKIKPSKCRSLSLLKGNCKEIKFSVSGNEIPTIREKSVKSLGHCYSLLLTDRHWWQDLSKQLQDGLHSIDKCDLINKTKTPKLSLVEEYKLGKERLFQMLCDSRDPLVKNAQPSVITGWKWKAKVVVENAELPLRMKEIIGTVANGKAGLGQHPQRWWSKESTANRRKMVLEEIHHLEEIKCFATVVGQRK